MLPLDFFSTFAPADWAGFLTVSLYFLVMAALSVHGAHRMHLIRLFRRLWKQPQQGPADPSEWPRVTVQLPIYNERFVVESLLESVCRLDYPREKLEIQVLDDSTDETARVAKQSVFRLAGAGHPIEYFRRPSRKGYKAGALQNGLAFARGELIALFDADFLPAPDFLRRTVPYFADAKVGCVQARWEYRNREESLLTRVQGMLLDAHFVIEQVARSRSGLFFNFNGTAGVLRREMIEDAGGWEHDTLTEDTDLSYRAQLRGWRFRYLPDVAVESELPSDIASFQTQQARWAKGLVQTGLKLAPRILRSPQPFRVKAEALLHFSANASYPLMTLLAALLVPASIVRASLSGTWLLALDTPVFLSTFGSLALYYLLPRLALSGKLNWRDLVLFPAALACGIGLIVSNTKAVLEAFAGFETPFERTAKMSANGQRTKLAQTLYAIRPGWLPWANLAAAGAILAGAIEIVRLGAWPSTPFLALFVAGFGYAGGLAIRQSFDGASKRLPAPALSRQPVRSSAS